MKHTTANATPLAKNRLAAAHTPLEDAQRYIVAARMGLLDLLGAATEEGDVFLTDRICQINLELLGAQTEIEAFILRGAK